MKAAIIFSDDTNMKELYKFEQMLKQNNYGIKRHFKGFFKTKIQFDIEDFETK